jgi:hypothetical protein
MCAAKVIPTSKSTPGLDLKKLNQSESLQLLSLAIKKYPEFANDVSKVIDGTESRIRLEATKKFYDDLLDKVWCELNSDGLAEYDEADFDPPRPNADTLAEALNEIGKSVSNQTLDEDFEIAFVTLLRCWGLIMEVQEGRDEYEPDFDELEGIVDDAQVAVKEMALLWVMKEGRFSKDCHQCILKLLEENPGMEDDAIDDIKDALNEELEALEYKEAEQEDAEDIEEQEEQEEQGEIEEGEEEEGPRLKRIRIG